jgi:hypothetical protein
MRCPGVSDLSCSNQVQTTYAYIAVKNIPDWFPGANFKRIAKEAIKISTAIRYELYNPTKERVVRIRPCYTRFEDLFTDKFYLPPTGSSKVLLNLRLPAKCSNLR